MRRGTRFISTRQREDRTASERQHTSRHGSHSGEKRRPRHGNGGVHRGPQERPHRRADANQRLGSCTIAWGDFRVSRILRQRLWPRPQAMPRFSVTRATASIFSAAGPRRKSVFGRRSRSIRSWPEPTATSASCSYEMKRSTRHWPSCTRPDAEPRSTPKRGLRHQHGEAIRSGTPALRAGHRGEPCLDDLAHERLAELGKIAERHWPSRPRRARCRRS